MLGPILVPVALAFAGGITAGWAGGVVGLGVGVLIDVTIVVGAAVWARRIGSLLEPEDAWAMAPRPPLFGDLVEWVYARVLSTPPD